MQPEGLKEYIAACRSQGLTDDQIREALRQAGWTDEQFAGEFSAPAQSAEAQAQPELPPPLPQEELVAPPSAEVASPTDFEMKARKSRSPVLGALFFFVVTTGGAWWLYIAAKQQLPIFLPIAISGLSLLLSWGLAYPGLSKSEK